MIGLSTDYLQNLMEICTFDSAAFKGVFSCDQFYQKVKDGQIILIPGDTFIINLSSRNHVGSHWVAVHIRTNLRADYFDAYGLDCFDDFINRTFEEQNITINTFKKRIQHPSSHFCGFYCVAYILCKNLGISNSTFASFFHENELLKNDSICVEIIRYIIQVRDSVY